MRTPLAAAALLLTGALASPASAEVPAGTDSSFDGQCSADATVIPYTDFDGVGTCSGTLDGRPVTNAPVHIVATAQGLTLPVLPVLQKGQGVMTFGTGEEISFTFDQAVAGLVIKGRTSGVATGLAIPIPNLTGADTTTAQLVALTVTPLVG